MEIEDGPREYLWSTPRHMNRELGEDMDRFAISATLEARPGKEGEVEEFLKSAQPLVKQEAGTTTWFAFRIGPATFGIFDTFANEAGLQAHLNGAIAKALFAKAEELFAKPPQIQQVGIFAAKPLS
jgi:quinol monooxygenase YgiN